MESYIVWSTGDWDCECNTVTSLVAYMTNCSHHHHHHHHNWHQWRTSTLITARLTTKLATWTRKQRKYSPFCTQYNHHHLQWIIKFSSRYVYSVWQNTAMWHMFTPQLLPGTYVSLHTEGWVLSMRGCLVVHWRYLPIQRCIVKKMKVQ